MPNGTSAEWSAGKAARTARGPVITAVGASGGLAALRIGRQLARREGIEHVVVSVVEPPPVYDVGARRVLFVPEVIEAQTEERRGHVRERLARLFSSADQGGAARIEVSYGDVATEVTGVAGREHARLIVMGIGPHAKARRLLSMGTAWETSRQAPCPVLAVSEHASELPRCAVIATDFSPESIVAAREAISLLADRAAVHIVHAWSPLESLLPLEALSRLNDAYAASLPERFDRFRAALGRNHSCVCRAMAMQGKPAEVVLALAHGFHADLVVAGTHGYGTLERWVLGSTSSALLRGAECSVLLAPPPGAVEHAQLTRHMSGTSTMRAWSEWDEELRAFVERNHGRPTMLEMDDASIGAQVQESGYLLSGASYDPHDRHVALMFGGGAAGASHFTRSLGGVRSIAVSSSPRDEDIALSIESDEGKALLTFLKSQRSAGSESPADAGETRSG